MVWASLFWSIWPYRGGPMPQGVSYVQISRLVLVVYIRNTTPAG